VCQCRLDFLRSLVSGLVPSGEERGLLSRTAAGDRAYFNVDGKHFHNKCVKYDTCVLVALEYWRTPKSVRGPHERFRIVSENVRRWTLIIVKCFHHTPTNLSTDSRQEIDISPVRQWKMRQPSPASDFECIRRVVCIFLYKTALAINIFPQT